MTSDNAHSLLGGYRALDLTDAKGSLCSKILADFGADVIKIEKPGGAPSRNIGPFYHDIPDPEKSLFWFAFNANKRGITLDIESADGRVILKRLVKTADFVVESFPVGYMDRLGLGYAALSQINPRIIVVSITPFGQDGPYAEYKDSDIVIMAMSGYMSLCGEPGRPPVRISVPQSYCHAGADGAVAAMLAHYHRGVTGEGQHVDVSMQQAALVGAIHNAHLSWDMYHTNLKRTGPFYGIRAETASANRIIWGCRDGYVVNYFTAGRYGARSTQPLIEWMDEEGMAPDFVKAIEWEKVGMEDPAVVGLLTAVGECKGRFFALRTKKELHDEAVKRRFWLCPVSNPKDIVNDPQLSAREFWVEVQHPELGDSIMYPGACLKMSHTPLSLRHRAPLVGEHNAEVYQGELGFSEEELTMLKQAGVV